MLNVVFMLAVAVIAMAFILRNWRAALTMVIASPLDHVRQLHGAFAYEHRSIWLKYVWIFWTAAALGYVVRELLTAGPIPALFVLLFSGLVSVLFYHGNNALEAIPDDSPLQFLAWVPTRAGWRTWANRSRAGNSATLRGSSVGDARSAAAEHRANAGVDLALNIHIGGLPIDHTTEAEHFLISGKTGAGKSQAINSMLRTVRERADAGLAQNAIIADPAGGYWQKFAREGDLLLNPFDARSAAWSPFAELEEDSDCQSIARAAIPDTTGESGQWHHYAQTLFAEVLRVLWRRGEHSTHELLRLIMSAERKELAEVVAGTPAAMLASKESERMLGNTRAIAATFLNVWTQLPDQGTFSIRQWVRGTIQGPGPWLFLTYRDSQMALMRNLVACWLELAIVENLDQSEDTTGLRRLWYVMDELDSLGKIGSLRAGLTKLRKYGGVGVCGLQTIAQLRDRYGREEAQTLLSCMSTKLLLAAGDAETAEYFSKEIGDREVVRVVTSTNRGSSEGAHLNSGSQSQGSSASEQYATERTVLASQITSLSNLHGFLKRVNRPEWMRVEVPYVAMPAYLEAYEPRQRATAPAAVDLRGA